MGAWRPYTIGRYSLGQLNGEGVCVWREDGKRRRFRLGVSTEHEGRQALDAFVRARERATAKERETIAELHAAYISDRTMDGKPTTNADFWWRALKSTFGHLKPGDVDKRTCQAYRDARLAAGISIGTVWTELTQLRSILNWAVKARIVGTAPHVWVPTKPPPRDRRLTREEATALIHAAREPHLQLFIILALATAGRKDAILGLTWDRVDFSAAAIDLRDPTRAETNKGRARVAMNDMARAALSAAYQGRTCDYVIEWKSARVKSILKGFQAAAARAGLADVSPHVLRHTAACWMAEAGVEMALISQYLGHRNVATTSRIYARYSPHGMAKAAEVVSLDLRRVVRS